MKVAQRALRRRIPGAEPGSSRRDGEQEPRLAVLAKLADFYDLSLDALVGRQRSVRVTALLENTAGREGLCAAHGLSLYIETPRYKILFDMGPGDEFLSNAEALGVDLTAVDLAVLSHGHDDHGGGLAAFCRVNDHAPIYLHRSAFGPYYILSDDRDPAYIGLPWGWRSSGTASSSPTARW